MIKIIDDINKLERVLERTRLRIDWKSLVESLVTQEYLTKTVP